MFGIAVVPVMVGIGATIDYTRLGAIRSKLNHAADVATLASISKNAQPFVNTPTQAAVQNMFRQEALAVTGATITSANATITPGVTALSVSLGYTANVPLIFGAFLGQPSVSISVRRLCWSLNRETV